MPASIQLKWQKFRMKVSGWIDADLQNTRHHYQMMIGSIQLKWTKFRMKIRGWIDAALQNTHDHYLCYLPGRIGLFSSFILKLFFSGIQNTKGQPLIFKELHPEGIFVYATQYKSYFEFLFYYTRYKYDHLPFPEIGMDYKVFFWQPLSRIFRILLGHLDYFFYNLALPDPYQSGYIKKELMNGRSALVSLVDKKAFYRRFVKAKKDPIRYLIEMQKSIDRPIYIVPQLMFFGKKPYRSTPNLIDILFGSEEKPGKIRRLATLFKNPGKVFVEISEPVDLKKFLERAENRQRSIEYLSIDLRRLILDQINRHRQSTTGPILKTREELKQNILTTERLRNFMDKYAKKRNIPIGKVHKEADAYLEEIAAKYNIAIIKIAAAIVGWIINLIFEGVMVSNDDINRIKSLSQKGPLILVPCHKSHIDYLILSLTLFNNNMPCPHVAAGRNLSFWPVGPMFRGAGAFFIRRTYSKGSVLYPSVFSEYIENLIKEGFNIEVFIEGGRSRTGKLIPPKLGFLSILLNAYKNGACDDLILVPIYIGYDQILEESSYINEIEGGQKKPESFMEVIKAKKFLKKRYGKIYIEFNEPISAKEIVSNHNSPITEMSSKEFNALCRNLGHRIINAINRVTVVTPHALVACAILSSSKTNFTYDHLMSHLETYLIYLDFQGAKLADTLNPDHRHAFKQVFDSYLQRKFIEPISKESLFPETYMVNVSKRPILEYYKNNCIAFFIPAAFTALAILEKDTFQFSSSDLHAGYTFLQEFFKNEFAYDVDKTPEYFARKNIKAFIDDEILIPHPTLPDTYNLTPAGLRKLKLFSSLLKTYFESYWIVLNFFMRYPKKSAGKKERLKKIQARGNRMYKRKEIELNEALSKMNYQNALDYFIYHGIKCSEDTEKIEFYSEAIQKYLTHL